MPNKASALKELRKNQKQAAANIHIKTHLKHLFRKGLDLIWTGQRAEAVTVARNLQQAADKAAKRRVLSSNAANRKKSALLRAMAVKA